MDLTLQLVIGQLLVTFSTGFSSFPLAHFTLYDSQSYGSLFLPQLKIKSNCKIKIKVTNKVAVVR